MTISEITHEGHDGDLRIGVVVSEFNAFVTEPLLKGCLDALADTGIEEITVAKVSGALEIPVVAQRLAATHDAVIAIGAVIEGETDHYTHVANAASAGIAQVALVSGKPIGNAVLTVRSAAHARDRSLEGPSNKGFEAAEATVRAARVLAQL